MKVLIPMAGAGSRFAKEGYTFPKPLIDVRGKPMIQTVVENLDFDCEYIFLVRKEHIEQYSGLINTLDRITNGKFEYVVVDGLTEGAACTALLAEEFIDNDEDLLIANSDQYIEYSPENFLMLKNLTSCDIYWYRHGSDFVKYAKQMIEKDIRVNNEFYIAPVYNELIQDGKTLIPFYVHSMWGIGTPEDLRYFLEKSKK